MDDNKKKIIIIVAAVVAIGFAVVMFNKSGVAGPPEQPVGSLEGGVNKQTGLPLDPPKSNTSPATDPSGMK